ncbi:MAG: hypothetical protein IPN94_09115 [Sphingobacteriales bacterium]|nr:hypothetical protein [Sphingobacteriales bacterium]
MHNNTPWLLPKRRRPFVFGRATEEIDAALQHGIAVELIPGMSSALAVPALQGIP